MDGAVTITEAAQTVQLSTEAQTAAAASIGQGEALSVGMALIVGAFAMVLIYIVTVFLPKIAGAVDRAWSKVTRSDTEKTEIHNDDAQPSPARVEDIYTVHDIYEGELNLDNDNDNKKE